MTGGMAVPRATSPLARKRFSHKALRTNIDAYTFLLPTLILFCVFTVYPFFNAFFVSLTNWDGLTEAKFIGLQNFSRLMGDAKVWKYLGNNLQFGVFTVFFKVFLGFVIALFLNERFKGVAFFRCVFFVPVMMSFVAIGMLWKWIYTPSSGLINSILFKLGLMNQSNMITWLGDAKLAMYCIITVDIWRWTGYHVVIFLAGLQTIPNELYEAAIVDGANDRQQLRYITLPQMYSITLTNMIFCMTGAVSVFDLIFTMTGGGPYNVTKTIAIHVYEIAFGSSNKFGYTTAINILLFFIILIITTVMIRWMNRVRKNTCT
jgi:ABC-type sugar transport system permease subunit